MSIKKKVLSSSVSIVALPEPFASTHTGEALSVIPPVIPSVIPSEYDLTDNSHQNSFHLNSKLPPPSLIDPYNALYF